MLHGYSAYKAILQLHQEGLFYLYRGILPPLCQKTVSMSIMFGVYGASFNYLQENTEINIYVNKIISGIISGTIESTLTPFERIQTLLQDSKYHRELKNTTHAFKELKPYGLGEYYRALVPILLRNGPSNACFFILRDEVQLILPKYDSPWKSLFVNFLSGALIGATVSAIFYPLNVVKIAMQEKIGGKFENFVTVLIRIYHERGNKVRHLYHGLGTNCTRAFFSWGVVCSSYEILKGCLYR